MTGFGRIVAIGIVLMLSFVAIPAMATGENDAGSGRDAGDDRATAIHVSPGSYSGSMGPDDLADQFAIDVPAGYGLTAGGRMTTTTSQWLLCIDILDGMSQEVGTPRDGYDLRCSNSDIASFAPSPQDETFFVRLSAQQQNGGTDELTYELHLNLTPLADFVPHIVDGIDTTPSSQRSFEVVVENHGIASGYFNVLVKDQKNSVSTSSSDTLQAARSICSGFVDPGEAMRFSAKATAVGSAVLEAKVIAVFFDARFGSNPLMESPTYESDTTNNVALHYSPGPVELPTGFILPTSCVPEGS